MCGRLLRYWLSVPTAFQQRMAVLRPRTQLMRAFNAHLRPEVGGSVALLAGHLLLLLLLHFTTLGGFFNFSIDTIARSWGQGTQRPGYCNSYRYKGTRILFEQKLPCSSRLSPQAPPHSQRELPYPR